MQVRDASPEMIRCIEERGVAVRDVHTGCQGVRRRRGSQPGVESRTGWRYLPQPVVQMLANEAVIVQIWISRVHTVDLFHLPRRKVFIRVEAPAALEQALAP